MATSWKHETHSLLHGSQEVGAEAEVRSRSRHSSVSHGARGGVLPPMCLSPPWNPGLLLPVSTLLGRAARLLPSILPPTLSCYSPSGPLHILLLLLLQQEQEALDWRTLDRLAVILFMLLLFLDCLVISGVASKYSPQVSRRSRRKQDIAGAPSLICCSPGCSSCPPCSWCSWPPPWF